MVLKTDEEILLECYDRMANKALKKAQKINPDDKQLVDGITKSCAKLLLTLDSSMNPPMSELHSAVRKAKVIYIQFLSIKGRNPGVISNSLNNTMRRIIRSVCRHEANMISLIRTQETGGERIDIEEILCSKEGMSKLGNQLAKEVIKDAINDCKKLSPMQQSLISHEYYITETGRKYHLKNCPYCKGKALVGTSNKMIKYQKLEPCVCVLKNKDIGNYITVYVDESIHVSKWNKNGVRGKVGSFSYIICEGDISCESDITNEIILAQGVDYAVESVHTERITETAIGKVMTILAYDFEFTGVVTIYSDNQSAVDRWKDSHKNSKLANNFSMVKVIHIPREKNKKADALCRNRMFLNVPMDVYNEIVNKCDVYDMEYNTLLNKAVLWDKYIQSKEEKSLVPENNHPIVKIIGDVSQWAKSLLNKYNIEKITSE